MKKKSSFFILFFLVILISGFVSAVECGSVPTNGCVVTQNTVFQQGTYNLPNGIRIENNSLTLDCNGATLIGTNNIGTGIYININSTWVKNCIIKSYEFGISTGWGNNIILNNTFLRNNVAIITNGKNTFIRENWIENSLGGLPFYGAIIVRSSASNSDISYNNFINNTVGIFIDSLKSDINIYDNIFWKNDRGIYLFSTEHAGVWDNRFYGNSYGIDIYIGFYFAIFHNLIIGNNYGIHSVVTAHLPPDYIYYNDIYNNTYGFYDYSSSCWGYASDATYTWWGTINETEIQKSISGQPCLVYSPWATEPWYKNVCSDTTFNKSCSIQKPLYCDNNILINDCNRCGCLEGGVCQVDGSCQAGSVDTNELAIYHCNEGSGSKLIDSIGKYNGTWQGTPQWQNNITRGGYSIGPFSGSNYINLPTSLLSNREQGKISFWIYLTSWGPPSIAARIPISWNEGGGIYGYVAISSSTNIGSVSFNLNAEAISTASGVIQLNKWHHIKVTWDGSKRKIYVDGNLNRNVASTATFPQLSSLVLGKYVALGGYEVYGYLDEINISANATEPEQTCQDGTSYGSCSSTKPLYCSNGNLIEKCDLCGCNPGYCYEGKSFTDTVGYEYKNGSCMSDYEVLKLYSPAIYIHGAEHYYPTHIDAMLENADLKYGADIITPPVTIVGKPISEENLTGRNSNHYLDLVDSGCFAQNIDWYCSFSSVGEPSDFIKFRSYGSLIYGRIFRDTQKYPDKIVLQYWFFYVFDAKESSPIMFAIKYGSKVIPGLSNFIINNHEGDWEWMQIILEKNGYVYKPVNATYAHHSGKKTYNWDEVRKYDFWESNPTHPKVFVALYSHALYKDPKATGLLEFVETMPEDNPIPTLLENGLEVSGPIYLINIINESTSWFNFAGLWGQISSIASRSGPVSPGDSSRLEWTDPIEWANKPDDVITKAITGSPVDLHAYDPEGRHVGLNESGGYDAEIPELLFAIFPNRTSNNTLEKNIVVFSNTTNIMFIIKAYDSGSFDFSLEKINNSDSIKTLYNNISITNKTKAIVVEENYTMQVDFNGDNETDYQLEPSSIIKSNDLDGDGVLNNIDNCPDISNPEQNDSDLDGIGDVCDLNEDCNDRIDNDNDSFIDYPEDSDCIFLTDNSELKGDVNNDCKVNILDLASIGLCYGKSSIGECFNADLSGNGVVDIFDLASVGLNYGRSC